MPDPTTPPEAGAYICDLDDAFEMGSGPVLAAAAAGQAGLRFVLRAAARHCNSSGAVLKRRRTAGA